MLGRTGSVGLPGSVAVLAGAPASLLSSVGRALMVITGGWLSDEAGVAGLYGSYWHGMWLPKGTPKEIVAKLNAAAIDALNDPAVSAQLEKLGLQMPPKDKLTPAALGDWQKAEIAKWWPMIKAANVKVD